MCRRLLALTLLLLFLLPAGAAFQKQVAVDPYTTAVRDLLADVAFAGFLACAITITNEVATIKGDFFVEASDKGAPTSQAACAIAATKVCAATQNGALSGGSQQVGKINGLDACRADCTLNSARVYIVRVE